MISSITSLLLDNKLKSYWFSRGINAALSIILVIILKEFEYGNSTILLTLFGLYASKGIAFLTMDLLPSESQRRISYYSCILATLFSLYMFVYGINLLLICSIILLLQHAMRETINNGTSYVRERFDWPLGVDVASALTNEMGKGFGIILIALISVLMAIHEKWFFAILFFSSLIIVLGHPSLKSEQNTDIDGKLSHLDPFGRKLVLLSTIHNGILFGFQGFLTLALFDLLQGMTSNGNTSGKLGLMISVTIVISMMIYSWFKRKTDQIDQNNGSSPMLPLSILCIALICIITFCAIGLWQYNIISSTPAAFIIVSMMGLLIAFGSLFSVGFLQVIDAAYRWMPLDIRNSRRKEILKVATMTSQFSPAVAFLLIFLASVMIEDLSTLPFLVAGLVAVIEVLLLYFFYRLSKDEKSRSEYNPL